MVGVSFGSILTAGDAVNGYKMCGTPDGIGAFEVTKDFAAVMNDVHYGPSDRSVVDRSVLNVFFTDVAPSRVLSELMLGTNGVSKIVPPLRIPPNQVTKHTTRYRISDDISVLTVNPHLHMLGKSFLAFAVKPNGDTIPLIRILRWNFNWQYFYTYKKPVKISKGSTIIAEGVYDNTNQNLNNPTEFVIHLPYPYCLCHSNQYSQPSLSTQPVQLLAD